jgi:hypothetical protein
MNVSKLPSIKLCKYLFSGSRIVAFDRQTAVLLLVDAHYCIGWHAAAITYIIQNKTIILQHSSTMFHPLITVVICIHFHTANFIVM